MHLSHQTLSSCSSLAATAGNNCIRTLWSNLSPATQSSLKSLLLSSVHREDTKSLSSRSSPEVKKNRWSISFSSHCNRKRKGVSDPATTYQSHHRKIASALLFRCYASWRWQSSQICETKRQLTWPVDTDIGVGAPWSRLLLPEKHRGKEKEERFVCRIGFSQRIYCRWPKALPKLTRVAAIRYDLCCVKQRNSVGGETDVVELRKEVAGFAIADVSAEGEDQTESEDRRH